MILPGYRSTRGFTLVELLIGASLSAAIMLGVISSYLFLGRQLTRLANQQALETEARRTLGYFAQDAQTATAVNVASVTAPDFQVTFTLPRDSNNATQAIYYYSRNGVTTSLAGNTVTIPARSMVRILSTGYSIVGATQVLLRNTVATDEGCYLRFYDTSGNPYDNGTAPYTPVTTYWSGVKSVSLSFTTQTGTAANGTQTPVFRTTTGRLLLRNKPLLQ